MRRLVFTNIFLFAVILSVASETQFQSEYMPLSITSDAFIDYINESLYEDADAYTAYHSILKYAIDKYGIGGETDDIIFFTYTNGLYSAHIIDFDNNGLPELLLTYYADGLAALHCVIYGFDTYSHSIKLLYAGESHPISTGPSHYHTLADKSGKYYLYKSWGHSSGWHDYFYTLQNNEWVLVLGMRVSNWEIYHEDGTWERVYFFNEQPVSQKEYYTAGLAALTELGWEGYVIYEHENPDRLNLGMKLDTGYDRFYFDWQVLQDKDAYNNLADNTASVHAALTQLEALHNTRTAAYAAYHEILTNAMDAYGIGDPDYDYGLPPVGLYAALLIDFDNDGIPELLLTHFTDDWTMHFWVYGYAAGEPILHYKGAHPLGSTGSYWYFVFSSTDGKKYLIKTFGHHGTGLYEKYYTLKDHKWTPVLDARIDFNRSGNWMYEDDLSAYEYFIDGEAVSEQAYNTMVDTAFTELGIEAFTRDASSRYTDFMYKNAASVPAMLEFLTSRHNN
jgi:hypothetical protein